MDQATRTETTPRWTRRLTTRVVVAVAVAVAATGLMAGPANAADYDSTNGSAVTVSGASGVFSALCGGTRGELTNSFGLYRLNPAPHYWRFAQRRVGGAWSTWTPWYTATMGVGASVPIVLKGDWQFVAQIAYWNGQAWEYDAEFVQHRNYQAGAYRVASSCHIG